MCANAEHTFTHIYWLTLGNITEICIRDSYPACHKEQLMLTYILSNGCYDTGSIYYAQFSSIPQQ